MAAKKLDMLPSELLSNICEVLYRSHKHSLRSLTLANKKCEAAATAFLFRDLCIYHIYLQSRSLDTLVNALTRRGALKHVRRLVVHGTFKSQPPRRLFLKRPTLLDEAEWEQGGQDDFQIQDRQTESWEDEMFIPLARLIRQLTCLITLRWEMLEQLPSCILSILPGLREDLRLELPEFRFRSLSRNLDPREFDLITSPCLRSITGRIAQGDGHRQLLLRMLAGISPTLEEMRIVRCESVTRFSVDLIEEANDQALEKLYRQGQRAPKAKLTYFSIHGELAPIENRDLERWFAHADMSFLRCLELRSGVESVAWSSTIKTQALPCLQELLLGFNYDCSRGEHDAATEWIRKLQVVDKITLQRLELRGNVSPDLVSVALKVHGTTLRRLSLVPQAHTSLFSLKYIARDLERMNQSCPMLQELTIPIKRGLAVGHKFHEAQNYKALGSFANLTHLRVILDCARWGDVGNGWLLADSRDMDFEDRTYYTLDTRRITYGHVRYALMNAAVDENLACTIWDIITSHKAGLPLSELYVQPSGSMEIVAGFRPDDRPELASQLTDLYALLREVSRPYKLERHVRDDRFDLVVSEPPDAIPRFHWSQVSVQERKDKEVICHPKEKEMQIFSRIWPRRSHSLTWRDDWTSFDPPLPI